MNCRLIGHIAVAYILTLIFVNLVVIIRRRRVVRTQDFVRVTKSMLRKEPLPRLTTGRMVFLKNYIDHVFETLLKDKNVTFQQLISLEWNVQVALSFTNVVCAFAGVDDPFYAAFNPEKRSFTWLLTRLKQVSVELIEGLQQTNDVFALASNGKRISQITAEYYARQASAQGEIESLAQSLQGAQAAKLSQAEAKIDADALLANQTIGQIIQIAQEKGVESVSPPAAAQIVSYDAFAPRPMPLLMRTNAFLELNDLEFAASQGAVPAEHYEYLLLSKGVPIELQKNMRANEAFLQALERTTTLGTVGPFEVPAFESYLLTLDFALSAQDRLGASKPIVFWLDIKLGRDDWQLDVNRTTVQDSFNVNQVVLRAPVNLAIKDYGVGKVAVMMRVRAATIDETAPRQSGESGFLDRVKQTVSVASRFDRQAFPISARARTTADDEAVLYASNSVFVQEPVVALDGTVVSGPLNVQGEFVLSTLDSLTDDQLLFALVSQSQTSLPDVFPDDLNGYSVQALVNGQTQYLLQDGRPLKAIVQLITQTPVNLPTLFDEPIYDLMRRVFGMRADSSRATVTVRPCGIVVFGSQPSLQLSTATQEYLEQIFVSVLGEVFQQNKILPLSEFETRYNALQSYSMFLLETVFGARKLFLDMIKIVMERVGLSVRKLKRRDMMVDPLIDSTALADSSTLTQQVYEGATSKDTVTQTEAVEELADSVASQMQSANLDEGPDGLERTYLLVINDIFTQSNLTTMSKQEWLYWFDNVQSDYMAVLDTVYFAKNSVRIMVPEPFEAKSLGFRPFFVEEVRLSRTIVQSTRFIDYIKSAYGKQIEEWNIYDETSFMDAVQIIYPVYKPGTSVISRPLNAPFVNDVRGLWNEALLGQESSSLGAFVHNLRTRRSLPMLRVELFWDALPLIADLFEHVYGVDQALEPIEEPKLVRRDFLLRPIVTRWLQESYSTAMFDTATRTVTNMEDIFAMQITGQVIDSLYEPVFSVETVQESYDDMNDRNASRLPGGAFASEQQREDFLIAYRVYVRSVFGSDTEINYTFFPIRFGSILDSPLALSFNAIQNVFDAIEYFVGFVFDPAKRDYLLSERFQEYIADHYQNFADGFLGDDRPGPGQGAPDPGKYWRNKYPDLLDLLFPQPGQALLGGDRVRFANLVQQSLGEVFGENVQLVFGDFERLFADSQERDGMFLLERTFKGRDSLLRHVRWLAQRTSMVDREALRLKPLQELLIWAYENNSDQSAFQQRGEFSIYQSLVRNVVQAGSQLDDERKALLKDLARQALDALGEGDMHYVTACLRLANSTPASQALNEEFVDAQKVLIDFVMQIGLGYRLHVTKAELQRDSVLDEFVVCFQSSQPGNTIVRAQTFALFPFGSHQGHTVNLIDNSMIKGLDEWFVNIIYSPYNGKTVDTFSPLPSNVLRKMYDTNYQRGDQEIKAFASSFLIAFYERTSRFIVERVDVPTDHLYASQRLYGLVVDEASIVNEGVQHLFFQMAEDAMIDLQRAGSGSAALVQRIENPNEHSFLNVFLRMFSIKEKLIDLIELVDAKNKEWLATDRVREALWNLWRADVSQYNQVLLNESTAVRTFVDRIVASQVIVRPPVDAYMFHLEVAKIHLFVRLLNVQQSIDIQRLTNLIRNFDTGASGSSLFLKFARTDGVADVFKQPMIDTLNDIYRGVGSNVDATLFNSRQYAVAVQSRRESFGYSIALRKLRRTVLQTSSNLGRGLPLRQTQKDQMRGLFTQIVKESVPATRPRTSCSWQQFIGWYDSATNVTANVFDELFGLREEVRDILVYIFGVGIKFVEHSLLTSDFFLGKLVDLYEARDPLVQEDIRGQMRALREQVYPSDFEVLSVLKSKSVGLELTPIQFDEAKLYVQQKLAVHQVLENNSFSFVLNAMYPAIPVNKSLDWYIYNAVNLLYNALGVRLNLDIQNVNEFIESDLVVQAILNCYIAQAEQNQFSRFSRLVESMHKLYDLQKIPLKKIAEQIESQQTNGSSS